MMHAYSPLLIAKRRRGSVFVLVVAILAVLGLLTLTLAYSTRMELQSSRNSTDAVQARLSALTNVPFVTPGNPLPVTTGGIMMDPSGSPVASTPVSETSLSNRSVNSTVSSSLANSTYSSRERKEYVALNLLIKPGALDRSNARQESAHDSLSSTGRVSTDLRAKNLSERAEEIESRAGRLTEAGENEAVIANLGSYEGGISSSVIRDESAKLNINAILPPPSGQLPSSAENIQRLADPKRAGPISVPNTEHLALLIEQVAHLKEISLERSGLDLANEIVSYRYGPDGAPGVAGLDDNGNGEGVLPASDGLDNDGDWVVDNPEEATLAIDADGLDNNLDGVVDEMGESLLRDGLDNNGDGILDNPSETMDDPAEFISDIRLAPNGDDRPFIHLADLAMVRGMTTELIDALAPYLTTFSVSQPAYVERKTTGQSSSVTGLRQLDPNSASPEQIFEMLRAQYPALPEALVGQFSVNIVDRRDADDVPTEAQLGSGGTTFRGMELTPCINEVFPYTGGFDQSEGGDDGQFVELANPYTSAIDVTGWRLEGLGTVVYLNGTIQGGGLLVFTDDYNNTLDPEPEDVPGQGSLYDIFGAVPTGGKTRLEVNSSLTLPDDAGSVRLYNKSGSLVDEFRYEGGKLAGVLKYAYQREDPRIRKALYTRDDCDYGTPLKPNQSASKVSGDERRVMELVEEFYNRPFLSPLELLLVPTNYEAPSDLQPTQSADAIADDDGSAVAEDAPEAPVVNQDPQTQGFRLPYLGQSAESRRLSSDDDEPTDETSDNFDVTIVDLFMPGLPAKRDTRMMSFLASGSLSSGDGSNPLLDPSVSRIETEWKARRDAPAALHGRININTASPLLLSALPGVGPDFAYVIATLREHWIYGASDTFSVRPTATVSADIFQTDAWKQALPPLESVRWRSLSDLISDNEAWGPETLLINRIEACYPFANMIAFNSLSYRVTTENIPPPDNSGRQPTIVRTERIVAGDRGRPETVRFRPMARPGWVEEDRDTKFGLPENGQPDLSKDLLAKADMSPLLPRYDGPAFPVSVPNIAPTSSHNPLAPRSGASRASTASSSVAPTSAPPPLDSATSPAP